MPEISAVVAIYNTADYLSKCIDSLLNQTFTDFEVILVNDGSTDGCPDICRRYAEKDSRIRVIDKPNGGLSDARNAGMKQAAGTYLIFIDSDDFVEPDLFDACFRALKQTDADMVIFDVYQYHMKTGQRETITIPYRQDRVYALADTPEIMTHIMNAAWNKMYRRTLFTENGIEYPKGLLYEDISATYRLLLRASRVAFVNKPLYDYLVDRPGNITQQFNKKVYNILEVVQQVLDDYRNQGAYERYYEELKYIGCVNILECLKKTRQSRDREQAEAFIDACYAFIRSEWPEFPSCRYPILREKNDWIYADPHKLKMYLAYQRIMRRDH